MKKNDNHFIGSCYLLLSFLFFLLLYPSNHLLSQSNPCDCTKRWKAGAKWVNGSVDNNPNPTDFPLGIARCTNSFDTHKKITADGCSYDANDFAINCPTPPDQGDDLVWINFDLAPLIASFKMKVVSSGTNQVAWALYVSSQHQAGTDPPNNNGESLSGDCSSLNLYYCGSGENAQTISNLNPGLVNNYYLAVWSTNNKSLKKVKLRIKKACADCDDPPLIICNANASISLTSDGTASIPADAFIQSAMDGCTETTDLQYRIQVPSLGAGQTSPPTTASTTYTFDCSQIGPSSCDSWVSDADGNWAYCSTNLIIEDKLAPSINCPNNISLDCEQDVNDLNITGQAFALDNCQIDSIIYSDNSSSTNCGNEIISREWQAFSNGLSTSCIQTITILAPPALQASDIIWPLDFSSTDCSLKPNDLLPNNLPPAYGNPILQITPCQQVAISYTDQILTTGCLDYKILREWQVIDWCTGDIFSYIQVLKIVDEGFHETDIIWPADFSSDDCSLTTSDLDPNNLSIPFAYPILNVDACDQIATTYTDQLLTIDCNSFKIIRSWTVIDWCTNNQFSHDQVLKVVDEVFSQTDITWPADFSSDDCSLTTSDLDPNNLPNPFAFPILQVDACDQVATAYTDQLLTIDCNSFKIIRSWTVIDWCTNNQFSYDQVLKVMDEGFSQTDITWPADFSSDDCSLTSNDLDPNNLPDPFTYPILQVDACDQVATAYADQLLTIDCNSFKIIRSWTVIDWCTNNQFSYDQILKVVDEGFSQTDITWPADFSSDDCSLTTNDLDPNNLPDPFAFPILQVDACDQVATAYTDQLLTLDCNSFKIIRSWTVIDWCTNNQFSYDQVLKVAGDGFSAADITWPADYFTDDCSLSPADLAPDNLPNGFGNPILQLDGCDQVAFSYTDQVIPTDCISFKIIRSWTVIDWCTYDPTNPSVGIYTYGQVLKIAGNGFAETDITWPADYFTSDCSLSPADLAPDNLPAGFGNPILQLDGCDQVAISYDDLYFNTCGSTSIKVLRKWTVIDWCTYDPSNPTTGIFTYTQVLKIDDVDAPTISGNCDDLSFCCTQTNCIEAFANLVIQANDNCTTQANLSYSYQIDLFDDSTIDVIGNTNDASGVFPIGQHSIQWQVTDPCGNSTTCVQDFKITTCSGGSSNRLQAGSNDVALRNFPNPSYGLTTISFYLEDIEDAQLTIYNVDGVVLKTYTGFSVGYNELTVDTRNLEANGVVFYRLATAKFNRTKKMIIARD